MILNDPPPTPTPTPRAPKKINVAVLLITASVFITAPLLVFAGLYLWLNQTSFASVDELNVAELESVRVQMLNLIRGAQNRPDPPPGENLPPEENTTAHHDPDIDPVELIRPDFEVIFQPLLSAEEIDHSQWPAAVFLGEIRVRYKDGRPGTIRLYRAADELPKGLQIPDDPARDPRVQRVYMKIGPHWYRACTLKELRTHAQACAERGTKAGR